MKVDVLRRILMLGLIVLGVVVFLFSPGLLRSQGLVERAMGGVASFCSGFAIGPLRSSNGPLLARLAGWSKAV
jgi:hypothetical protein